MANNNDANRHFSREVLINAPKDAVWKALSDAIELSQWFAPEAQIDSQPGGKVMWKWTDKIQWPLTIKTWEEGKRLVTEYDFPLENSEQGQVPLWVDFQIEGQGDNTRLRLIHSGFGPEADFDNEFDGISHGWTIELRSLQLYLEHHLGKSRQLTWLQAEAGSDIEAAWQQLTGPQALNCSAAIKTTRPGERFEFVTANGDKFNGETFYNNDYCFTGIVDNWDKSWLRIQIETSDGCVDSNQIWLWHATYGQDQNRTAALNQRWQQLLKDVFGDNALIDNGFLQKVS